MNEINILSPSSSVFHLLFFSLLHFFTSTANAAVTTIETTSTNYTTGITASFIVIGILCILTGLCFLFFGRRIFKIALFVAGFYVGILLGFIILVNIEPVGANGVSGWGDSRDGIYFGVCLASGILVGVLSSCFWRMGLFAIGAFGGFTLGLFILSWSSESLIQNNIGRWAFLIGLAIIGGILGLYLEHHVIIIATSIGGAYSIVFGVDCFANTGFRMALHAMMDGNPQDYQIENGGVYGLLATMIVLALIGILVQYRITGKNMSLISHNHNNRKTVN